MIYVYLLGVLLMSAYLGLVAKHYSLPHLFTHSRWPEWAKKNVELCYWIICLGWPVTAAVILVITLIGGEPADLWLSDEDEDQ